MPLLSVIIPVYNTEKYIEEAVESILKQPCKDVEIILINDGSKDKSGIIADSLATKYQNIIVYHVANGGVSKARNLGLKIATGDYIAFLDSDDVWCRDVYTDAMKNILCGKEYDILYFGYFKTDEKLKYGTPFHSEDRMIMRNDEDYDYFANKMPFCSYFYKRELIENVSFPEGIKIGEDVSFLFWATRNAKNMLLVNKYLFMYRTNIKSAINSNMNFKYFLNTIEAWYMIKGKVCLPEDSLYCDGRIYKMMYDYLRLSSKNGEPYQELHDNLMNNIPFKEAWENRDRYPTTKEITEYIELFMREPKAAWMKMRKKGFVRYTLRSLVKKGLFIKLAYRLKHKMDVREYVI